MIEAVETSDAIPQRDEGLTVGDRVGELRVRHSGPDRLVIGASQVKPLILLLICMIAMVGWMQGAMQTPTLMTGLLCFVALISLALSASTLGFGFVIDRDRGRIVKRRVFAVARWEQQDLASVSLSAGHRGPRQVMKLDLIDLAGHHIPLTVATTSDQGAALPAAAARIASLLKIPIVPDAGLSGAPLVEGSSPA